MSSYMYKANLFILEVKDSEDDFLYCTLIFDSQDKLDEAKSAIQKFNSDWYSDDELNITGSYYEDLIAMLDSKGYFEYEAVIETVTIR